MNKKTDLVTYENILEGFEFDLAKIRAESSDWRERKGITVHVPVRYQEKYKRIQALTNRKFHDKLKGLIVKVLDLMEVPEAS